MAQICESHCHDITAHNFTSLSGCTQLNKESTHKLRNCLDLLLTDVLNVVDPLVDSALGNFDHSIFSFSVKMGFKIPNIIFLVMYV